jgi:ARG and Rhodanese-Phosphatase-superfamily-associated Protein domain
MPRLCASAMMFLSAFTGLIALAASPKPYTVSGPYTHDNLAVFVIRGNPEDAREYLTLDEGLTAGVVAVREKGARQGQDRAEVNLLEIENRSNKWLFLQAGDIVKGGKQDRTIMTDLTLPPHSEPTAIDAFCVERGRWTARDSSHAFGTNTGIASGVALKRAIQGEKSQQRVWQEVAKADALAADAVRTIDASYVSAAGQSALSTTGTYNAIVENPALQSNRATFVKALLPQVQKDKNAIGMAVAINGEIVSADIYTSPALFQKLSRKLLDSYATEAMLVRQAKPAAAAAQGKDAVLTFLSNPEGGSSKSESLGSSMHQRTVEGNATVLYEYAYKEPKPGAPAKLVHQNYLKKQK